MKKITSLVVLLATALGFSQPTTNAPTPTHLAANVVSVYSNDYTNIATNYNPGWGQTGTVNTSFEAVSGSGNTIMVYSNFNYQGTDVTATNVAAMEYLHIDIWTSTATNVKVSPINSGSGAAEFLVNVPLVNGGWSSVDLPKSAFTGMTWDNVFQLKFDGQGGTTPSTIYLDNIYFWKSAVNPASDATLSDLQVDAVTVAGFSPSTLTYTVSVPQGTSTVPQITSATTTNASATKIITQATAIPGSATVAVTSQDATTTKTYTVNFAFDGPATAAPTPPARPAADVKSIFSNAYTPISTIGYTGDDNTYNNTWCPGTTTLVQIAGNDTHKVTGLGCEGVTFLAGRFDATSFTHLHMDIYTDTPTQDKSFNVKLSNWNGGSAELNAIEFSVSNGNFLTNPNPGTWISLDIPLANFTPINGSGRNDIVQFVISSDLGTVYYDNLYLHKGTVLGTSNFEAANLKLSPNPVSVGQIVTISADVTSVEVYSINGQLLSKESSNIIETTQLTTGIYIVKATDANGLSQVSKLIVK